MGTGSFCFRVLLVLKRKQKLMARVLACILWVSLAATHGKGELLEALVARGDHTPLQAR
jgi:hypothetical protein